MFIFPEENNAGLLPIPFHQHSPFHTLKVTDISVKLNRMQCKQSILSDKNKMLILNIYGLGKTDAQLSI